MIIWLPTYSDLNDLIAYLFWFNLFINVKIKTSKKNLTIPASTDTLYNTNTRAVERLQQEVSFGFLYI